MFFNYTNTMKKMYHTNLGIVSIYRTLYYLQHIYQLFSESNDIKTTFDICVTEKKKLILIMTQ